MRYVVAKEAVAIVSSCAHLPWMMLVWFLRPWLSTAFHTCESPISALLLTERVDYSLNYCCVSEGES